MKQRNSPPETPAGDDAVRLPALCGVRPGIYLAALYGALILVFLAWLFVYPGISRPGSMLTVTSEPCGAAIRIDDVYYASAPAAIFVPRGRHTLTAALPGFEPVEIAIEGKNRVVASRFFPHRITQSVTLKEREPLAALTLSAREYAAWCFAEPPTEDWQIPLALSEGVYRSAPADAAARSGAQALLQAAARFMATPAAAKDLARAAFLAGGGGNVPSPFAALDTARTVLDYMNSNRAFAVALGEVLGDNAAETLIESAWYPEVWQNSPRRAQFERSGGAISVAGIEFGAAFAPVRWNMNSGFQREVEIGGFAIASAPVSVDAWRRFLTENPDWQLKNRDVLLETRQITEDYLEPLVSFPDAQAFFDATPAYPAPAQPGVSFFAAEAFCRWLSAKLSPALAQRYEARLPTEAEWEFAAAARGNTAAKLWEWCADPFAPLSYLGAPQTAIDAVGSPERGVRGGSWANPAGAVLPEMRGSLPPETCSPFTGFRPVLAPRADTPRRE